MDKKTRKLFFERAQEQRGEVPQTFIYDVLSEKVRKQIVMIWDSSKITRDYGDIVAGLREAIGIFELADGKIFRGMREEWSKKKELKNFFLDTPNVEYALTALEEIGTLFLPDKSEGLERINERLRRAGIGWKHTGKILIRVEDETFYDEVTSRCLSVLSEGRYSDTQKHLMKAYEELKVGPKGFDDALTDCRMALESIIKTRLQSAGWPAVENLNWNPLKKILSEALIIPPYMKGYLGQVLSTMEGTITPSNKEGAHGKPEGTVIHADELFVRYIINQTAANILFIAEAEFKSKRDSP